MSWSMERAMLTPSGSSNVDFQNWMTSRSSLGRRLVSDTETLGFRREVGHITHGDRGADSRFFLFKIYENYGVLSTPCIGKGRSHYVPMHQHVWNCCNSGSILVLKTRANLLYHSMDTIQRLDGR